MKVLTDIEDDVGFVCDSCGESRKSFCIESLANHMIYHGVTVREPQKPLKLEDVFDKSKNVSDNVVWMEQEDEDGDMCVFPCLVSNFASIVRHGTQYLQFLSWPKQEYVRNYSDNRDYGKTWRCWAEKPTEEERMAAEWGSM